MKIIFLDIDGVMNTWNMLRESIDSIGDAQLDLLKHIVDSTGAKIVLSSTWRLHKSNRNIVQNRLKSRNMSFNDTTVELKPQKLSQYIPRSLEIQEWLDRNPETERFAILDDDIDAGRWFPHDVMFFKEKNWEIENTFEEFFVTDGEFGLTKEIADKVIIHLNWVGNK